MLTAEELQSMPMERLRRKANQAWECAGLARQDRDSKDEQRWTAEARNCEAEIRRRSE